MGIVSGFVNLKHGFRGKGCGLLAPSAVRGVVFFTEIYPARIYVAGNV